MIFIQKFYEQRTNQVTERIQFEIIKNILVINVNLQVF